MLPVTVRFRPTAAELEHLRAALLKGRPRPSIPLTVALSTAFILQGALRLAYPRHGHAMQWFGYAQIVMGVVYAPLMWVGRQARLSFVTPEREIEFRIDDAGITLVEPGKSIPWKSIGTILDVGDAFVFERSWDRRIAILKRALPDDGRALWTSLDEKLTSTRYLVRGTDSRRRIVNGLERD